MKRIIYESKLAKLILWSRYSTIMLFSIIFTKLKEKKSLSDTGKGYLSKEAENHEMIHVEQYTDLIRLGALISIVAISCGGNLFGWILFAILFYYILYVSEYLIRFIIELFKFNQGFNIIEKSNKAYHNISFEKEAYRNQGDMRYIGSRGVFSSFKYYF